MMDKVMQRIEEALDAYARPFLTEHMGDVKVSRVEDGCVYVQLQGACAGCASSSYTVGNLLKKALVEHVPGIREVIPESADTDFYQHAMQFYRNLKKEEHTNDKRV